MSDREALYRSILDNPDDDLPRLIFADWIEEHGEPERAEFIRIQIEKEQIRFPYVNRERWQILQDREWELLRNYGQEWEKEISSSAEIELKFRRGFLSQVVVYRLLQDAEEFDRLACQTPLQELCFGGPERSLMVPFPRLDPNLIQFLSTMDLLRHFRELTLATNPVRDQGIARLVQWPNLKRIRRLQLADTQIGSEGANILAQTPSLTGLEELDLSYNPIKTAGAKAILESPYLVQLQWIHLHHCQIDYRSKTARLLRDRFGDKLRW